jgi:hypothetical protein
LDSVLVNLFEVIGGERPTFKQLIIRNYEPPKTPLCTANASIGSVRPWFVVVSVNLSCFAFQRL